MLSTGNTENQQLGGLEFPGADQTKHGNPMDGQIKKKVVTGGGIDSETGIGEPVTTSWSDPVPCKYYATELDNKGRYEDGKFHQSSYTITTENMDFDADFVRLFDNRGKLRAEKEVISIETLDLVQRIKIII